VKEKDLRLLFGLLPHCRPYRSSILRKEGIDGTPFCNFQNWENTDFRPTAAKYRNLVGDSDVAP